MGDLDDQLRRLADQRAARTPETSATAAMAAGSAGGRPSPAWWLAAAAMLAVLAGAGAWLVGDQETADIDPAITTTTTTTPPTTSTVPTEPLQQLRALTFGVVIDAPATWDVLEPDQTWAGDTGFVAVDVAPHGSLEESAALALEQGADIAGENPTQTVTEVNGQPAITIVGDGVFASDLGEFQHAFTVIEAPTPVEDRDELWTHIVVASDADHHATILASLGWIGGPISQVVHVGGYGMEFSIPPDWEYDRTGSDVWRGDSGSVGLNASNPADLEAATDNSVNHRLRPYGDNPTVESLTIDGQPARLIRPDAETAPANMAELLITPPERVVIRGTAYGTINLYAEADIIDSIAATIRWIETDPPPRVDVDAPDPAITYDLIVGTDTGVELRHADNHDRVDVIDDLGPVDLAFLVGGHLVYQLRDTGDIADQGIRLAENGGWRPLDLGEGRLRLLDAKLLDGNPTALVTRRTGETPETANEDLLLIDLSDESVTNLGRSGGWESGIADARMGEGAIAVLASAEGFSWLRGLDYDGNELWAHEEDFDGPQGLVLNRDVVFATWIEPSGSTVTLVPYDLATGVSRGDASVRNFDLINDPQFQGGDCNRMVAMPFMCGRLDGPPMLLDFELTTADPLVGLTDGDPTIVNAEASRTAPVR